MKVRLMAEAADFNLQQKPIPQAANITQDLELATLFDAMAGDDAFTRDVVQAALLQSLVTPAAIRWRQRVLQDCARHRDRIEALYQLASDTLEAERKELYFDYSSASGNLMQAVGTLTRCHERLQALRALADQAARAGFTAPAFTQLFKRLQTELDDTYLDEIAQHLHELKFKYGVFASAHLGDGNKSTGFVLHQVPHERRGRWHKLLEHQPEIHAFEIAPRDDAAGRALSEVRNRALQVAADAVSAAADQVLAFFNQLRIELAFYRGALRLQDALAAAGMPTCEPSAANDGAWHAQKLYDPCLCLTQHATVVANDLAADGRDLVFVTGANQGGKSTFLRSLGVAQLLLQAGLFAPAQEFSAPLASGVFTHYKREEDAAMQSGKFDEELVRMDAIVQHLRPGALVLFNESFAATNEHEGAQIAADILRVLIAKDMRVVFVTNFYELALAFSDEGAANVLFLQAERSDDGSRTHRIRPGRPLRTAYGPDLHTAIFGCELGARAAPRDVPTAAAARANSDS